MQARSASITISLLGFGFIRGLFWEMTVEAVDCRGAELGAVSYKKICRTEVGAGSLILRVQVKLFWLVAMNHWRLVKLVTGRV